MALADRVIIGFDNVVRRGVHRRQHMAELVKHRQIIKGRVTAHIIDIPQEWRTSHRHEN